MNKAALYIVTAVLILGGVFAGYLYWQHNQPKPEMAQAPAPAPVAPKPEVRMEIVPAPVKSPIPQLADSDSFVLDALVNLIGDQTLVSLLNPKHIIRNIVATVDNLPRRRTPRSVLPIQTVAGKFLTAGKDEGLSINAANAARYTPYVRIAELIDTKKLAGLYVRLYPLFQQAYVELGYPKGYFNDRLLLVIDDLLDAPVPPEPVKLIKHGLVYQYADPDIEAQSIGQRILVRMGNANETRLKAKLRDFKSELALHLHEKIVDSVE